MNWYHIILYTLLTSTLLSIFTSYSLLRKRKIPGAFYYALTALAIAIWCFGYIIEFGGETIQIKFLGVQIQYLFGIPFVPVLWLSAALHFSRQGQRPTALEFILLSIIPVITTILIWTNSSHHLMYETITLHTEGSLALIKKTVGIWYYINVFYSYFVLVVGTVVLLKAIKKSVDIFKIQGIFFLAATFLPWIANFIYLAGMNSFMRIDLTPIVFSISLMLVGFAIQKYGLFEIVPAAHNLVIASTQNGVIVLDSNDRIVEVNPAMQSFIGQKNLIGRELNDVFAENFIDLSILEGDAKSKEININNEFFDLTISVVKDNNEEHVGSVLNFYNITERKNAERELLELNNAKDKLFSIIAHDLKNPFFGIIGLTEILYEDFDEMDNTEKKQMLKEVNELARNTNDILENLLSWSRQQTGKMEFAPKDLNINQLIEENIEAVKHTARLKNITINDELNYTGFVFADANMTKTILRNLIANALKFSMPGGNIIIITEEDGDWLKISVQDNGVGMDETTKEKLFRIDQSIKSTGTMGEKGTGLGLILCKEFVEKHGGTISVESEPGKGSKFTFSLPRSSKNNIGIQL